MLKLSAIGLALALTGSAIAQEASAPEGCLNMARPVEGQLISDGLRTKVVACLNDSYPDVEVLREACEMVDAKLVVHGNSGGLHWCCQLEPDLES